MSKIDQIPSLANKMKEIITRLLAGSAVALVGSATFFAPQALAQENNKMNNTDVTHNVDFTPQVLPPTDQLIFNYKSKGVKKRQMSVYNNTKAPHTVDCSNGTGNTINYEEAETCFEKDGIIFVEIDGKKIYFDANKGNNIRIEPKGIKRS